MSVGFDGGWRGVAAWAVSMAAVVVAVTAGATIAGARGGCINSGTEKQINAALRGRGARAVLCRGAVFHLDHTISFTASDQRLYTEGSPRGSGRARLVVSSTDRGEAVRVSYSRDRLSNVIVDGGAPHRGTYPHADGELIVLDGKATGQRVEWVRASYPQGGTHLDCDPDGSDGTRQVVVRHNEFGPGGRPGGDSPDNDNIADGISFKCRDSVVAENTVIDATDGGIVVFGANGTTIEHNTIRAETRPLRLGIAMADYQPTEDYTGAMIRDNVIDAAGAPIRIGFPMGPRTICYIPDDVHSVVWGGTVRDNVLRGAHMGYGYALSGVRDWTAAGNRDESQHSGQPFPQVPGGVPCGDAPPSPTGFQFDPQHVSNTTLEVAFQPGTLDGLLGICWPGDINEDGNIDRTDVQLLQAMIGANPAPQDLCRADLDRDGTVDQNDVTTLQGMVGSG